MEFDLAAPDSQNTAEHRLPPQHLLESRISPWNFPLLPVRKKNGKWRWVVDFRMLNSVTRKDSFPIPNIVELLNYLRKSKFSLSWI